MGESYFCRFGTLGCIQTVFMGLPTVGIERVIHFTTAIPGWPTIAAKCLEIGEPAVLRMIDGLPAFPDEVPDSAWRELRLGLTGGMVTLRRDGLAIHCVTWGTADPAMQKSWDRCTWAVAAAGTGTISLAEGLSLSATDFQKRFLEET